MSRIKELFKGKYALKLRELWKTRKGKLIILLLLLYILPSACNNMKAFSCASYDWSHGREVQEYVSPNGRYIASVHRDTGGLLGDWTTYVIVRSSKFPFLKRCVYKVRHSPACAVDWTTDGRLCVERTYIYPIGIWVHSSVGEGHL